MTLREAIDWLRMDSDDRFRIAAESFTAPSYSQVNDEVWWRKNKALQIVLAAAETLT